MRLVDAIAEASVHATQARRSERESRERSHRWLDVGNVANAVTESRSAAVYSARAEAWELAAKLMTEVTP